MRRIRTRRRRRRTRLIDQTSRPRTTPRRETRRIANRSSRKAETRAAARFGGKRIRREVRARVRANRTRRSRTKRRVRGDRIHRRCRRERRLARRRAPATRTPGSATPGLTNRAGTGETVPIAHARWRELARVGAVRTSSRVPPEVVTTRGVISFTASSARYANASSAADVARKPSVNLSDAAEDGRGRPSQRIRAVETMRETPKASPKAQPVEEVAWRTSIRATDPPPA